MYVRAVRAARVCGILIDPYVTFAPHSSNGGDGGTGDPGSRKPANLARAYRLKRTFSTALEGRGGQAQIIGGPHVSFGIVVQQPQEFSVDRGRIRDNEWQRDTAGMHTCVVFKVPAGAAAAAAAALLALPAMEKTPQITYIDVII
ncbi:hypothetical protein CCHR01_08887 [Colletotrichum chrysophilum]|uniref:Uncharacterized protein n=1 Tax=Colletotrichum chrysophilum TaxID=1836956 RepID=A0AAD9AHV2_9PEZI|nr:hypothetical protein CCHR01_08887 [Colletotrichum chrysophilum]